MQEQREELKKGENSTGLVIGGSSIYTGAPYFAALSSLRSGLDLVYIMTSRKSCIPLKILIPEAVVMKFKKEEWILNRINVCIIGPGLGRIKGTKAKLILDILLYLCDRQIPIIFDGDGLNFFSANIDIFQKFENIFLTPNHNEYKKLKDIKRILYMIRKDKTDIITHDNQKFEIKEPNSKKRCGGQGDILCGILAAELLKSEPNNHFQSIIRSCIILRKSSFMAEKDKGNSMITRDIIENIHVAQFIL